MTCVSNDRYPVPTFYSNLLSILSLARRTLSIFEYLRLCHIYRYGFAVVACHLQPRKNDFQHTLNKHKKKIF